MRLLIYIYAVLLLVSFVHAQSEDNKSYLVCMPASSNPNFTNDSEEQIPSKNVTKYSRPGKRGPPGVPGPPGPPGSCDKCEIVKTLQDQLLQMKNDQVRIINELKALQDFNKCIGGVVFNKYCYKLIYTAGIRKSYPDAYALCEFHGGSLTAIDSETMYDILYDYVQRTWNVIVDQTGFDSVQVWIEMLYQNGQLTFKINGHPASFIRWFKGYPTQTEGHINMAFEVAISPSHPPTNNGMFNINPAHTAVPLCRFAIDA